MLNISALLRFYAHRAGSFCKLVGIVYALNVAALRFDHLLERFERAAVFKCAFDKFFALFEAAFSCKIEHVGGKNHANFGKVLRAVSVESVDRLFHFESVADRVAQRSVHISDERKHLFAGLLADFDHRFCKVAACFYRLCKRPATRLDVKHYTIVVGGKFFAHDA